jgi:carbon monoxide dehydrogenase subunit G
MEPVYTTKLTVSFAIDLEVEYNSFGGKTVDKIAEALQDDLHDLLFELPHVEGVCTTLTNLGFND